MKSNTQYTPPSWSSDPTYQFHLQVIKEGATAGNILLPIKQFILFGKQPDICDVVLENPLISRKHAILQFKINDNQPHLYDLQSTHGVFVNGTKLPSRIYYRLNCFDTIQFGGSNKEYLLRCKELERQEDDDQNQEEQTDFQKSIDQKKNMSKGELKDKYLDLLNNDPYYNSNVESRKLVGKKEEKINQGVSWGISDQAEIYNFRNESQYPLEPELLRRLQIEDQRIIDKIADLQDALNKYREVQGQLRDLVNKQKKQYGLQDKLVNKKQNLEKKLIQTQQQLQKHEDYFRTTLFGQQAIVRVGPTSRPKQVDTFEDDQFYDRTLQKHETINLQALKNQKFQNNTTDYYKLRNRLQQLTNKQSQLNKRLIQNSTQTTINKEQLDQYELYLYESQKKLRQQNYLRIKQQIRINDQMLAITKQKLCVIQPEDLNKPIEYEKDNIYKEEKQKKKKKQKQQNMVIENALMQLSKLAKQQQQVTDDKQLFKIYQKKQKIKAGFKRQRHEIGGENEEIVVEKVKKVPVLPARGGQMEDQGDYEDLTKFD